MYGGRYGRWATRGHAKWAMFLSEFGLPATSLRKRQLRADAAGALSIEGADVTEQRSASSHALVALLLRWTEAGCMQQGRLCGEAVRKLKPFFSGIIPASTGRFESFSVSISTVPLLDDFGCVAGSHAKVVLPLNAGNLDLTNLFAIDAPATVCLRRNLRGVHIWPLHSLMGELLRGDSSWWLLKQLVWFVGTALDFAFADTASTQSLKMMSDTLGSRGLMRYHYAKNKIFDQEQFLSLCVDTGRIGKRNWAVGLMASNSTNHAGVLEPLDRPPRRVSNRGSTRPLDAPPSIPLPVFRWNSLRFVSLHLTSP